MLFSIVVTHKRYFNIGQKYSQGYCSICTEQEQLHLQFIQHNSVIQINMACFLMNKPTKRKRATKHLVRGDIL